MAKSDRFGASSYIAPLSARERELLAGWERARQTRLTRKALVEKWGTSVASDITKKLVRKGVIKRISRGVYWVVPMRAQARPTAISAPVALAAMLADEPYYLGGLWAFSYHRLTQQLYTSKLDAFVTRRRRPRQLAHATVGFHVVPKDSISAGAELHRIEGTGVWVGSAERTVLDALDYPDAIGGLRAALGLVKPALERVDSTKLIRMAAAHSRASTCQRLGVLLERVTTKKTRPSLAPLRRRVQETRSVLSMLSDAPRRGHLNPVWRVVENDR